MRTVIVFFFFTQLFFASCGPSKNKPGSEEKKGNLHFQSVFPDSLSCTSYDTAWAGIFNENAHPDYILDSNDSTAWIVANSNSTITFYFPKITGVDALKIKVANGMLLQEQQSRINPLESLQVLLADSIIGTIQLKKESRPQEFLFPLKTAVTLSSLSLRIKASSSNGPFALNEFSIEVQTSDSVNAVSNKLAQERISRRSHFRKEAANYLLRNNPPALSMPYTEGTLVFESIIDKPKKTSLPLYLLTHDTASFRKLFKQHLSASQLQFLVAAYAISQTDTTGPFFLPIKDSKAHLDIYFAFPLESYLAEKMLLLNPAMLRPAKPGELLKPDYKLTDEYGKVGPIFLPKLSNDSIKIAAVHTDHLSTDGDMRVKETKIHLFFYNNDNRLIRYVIFSSSKGKIRERVILYEMSYNEKEKLTKVKRSEAFYEGWESEELVFSVWEADVKSK